MWRTLLNKKFKNRYWLLYFISLIAIFLRSIHVWPFACNYEYIDKSEMWNQLAKSVSKNTSFRNAAVCDYSSIINEQYLVKINNLRDVVLDTKYIKPGGEYIPHDCKPMFSVAIIVPYRDRDEQLKDFLTHMHLYVMKQNIHYRIYVIEQDDNKAFNRAKLLNIGAVIAIHHGFPCIILHDVDLLPLVSNNIYACTQKPRHMSTTIDSFRFALPYNELFGGAVCLLSQQFIEANGMSNSYYGWGAEDDDLYERLSKKNLTPVRFHPTVSAYIMMKHSKAFPSSERRSLLQQAPLRFEVDGINSLKYIEKGTKLHPLFTHIIVQL